MIPLAGGHKLAHRIETIVAALRSLGGEARPADIAAEIRGIFPGPHPDTLLNSVRGRIQECSSSSKFWKRKRDLFYSVHGIGGGVWGLRDMDPLNPANGDGFSDDVEPFLAPEGAGVLKTHLRRERSHRLVERFKAALETWACAVCGFDFELHYGELGHGFIEAHHTIPVAQLQPGSKTSTKDLAAVCSNCHRMLHRGRLSIAELRLRLQRNPV